MYKLYSSIFVNAINLYFVLFSFLSVLHNHPILQWKNYECRSSHNPKNIWSKHLNNIFYTSHLSSIHYQYCHYKLLNLHIFWSKKSFPVSSMNIWLYTSHLRNPLYCITYSVLTDNFSSIFQYFDFSILLHYFIILQPMISMASIIWF